MPEAITSTERLGKNLKARATDTEDALEEDAIEGSINSCIVLHNASQGPSMVKKRLLFLALFLWMLEGLALLFFFFFLVKRAASSRRRSG